MQFEGFRICEGFLRDLKRQAKAHRSTESDLRTLLSKLNRSLDWLEFGVQVCVVKECEIWKFRIAITGSNIGKSNGFRLMVCRYHGENWLQFLYTHQDYASHPSDSEILERLPK